MFATNCPASTFFLCGLIYATFLIDFVEADLKYYFYSEENNLGGATIVLESVGSLPFEQSSYSRAGESCPSMVSKAGGVNSQYVCIGVHNEKDNFAFFPIAEVTQDSSTKTRLPFKFAALSDSLGTATGLLLWRNALAVDWSKSDKSDNANINLDAISFGKDTSVDRFNTKWVDSVSNGYQDGDIVAEWHLLSKVGGHPILNGGSIQLIKGKPPSREPDPSGTVEPSLQCQSITETVCANSNNDKFGTICSLLMQVGLDDVLNSYTDTIFTLYAPTNEAFMETYDGKTRPALLSGHELTKLLLNHVVFTNKSELSEFQYNKMVCGDKMIMASEQVAKIGCDENAEISYVIGAGNRNSRKPKFLAVDEKTCNGVIHTLDFVVLPLLSEGGVTEQHHHGHRAVDISTKEQNDGTKNNLDESEVISFFEQTIDDIEEIDVNDTAFLTANNENIIQTGHDIRPVSNRSQNPPLGSRTREGQLMHTRDDKVEMDHNRNLEKILSIKEWRKGHLRGPR